MGMVRLLLALSVVMAHASPIFGQGLVGGRAAVQCFFVISGFYITMILNQDYRNTPLFYLNRMLRIYPMYFAVLICILVLNHLGGSSSFSHITPIVHVIRFLTNFTLFFQDTLVFTGIGTDGSLHWAESFKNFERPGYLLIMIPPAWSISIELMFYLIAPFIVRRIPALLALLAASLAVRALTYIYISTGDPWTYRFILSEMGWFALGGLSYHLMRRFPALFAKAWLALPVTLGLILLMSCFKQITEWWSLSPLMGSLDSLQNPALELTCYTFILLTALALPFLFSAFRNIKSDRFLGDLSYPVYLCHIFVIRVLNEIGSPFTSLSDTGRGIITVLCACTMAVALLILIDRPIEGFRSRIRSEARQGTSPTSFLDHH